MVMVVMVVMVMVVMVVVVVVMKTLWQAGDGDGGGRTQAEHLTHLRLRSHGAAQGNAITNIEVQFKKKRPSDRET